MAPGECEIFDIYSIAAHQCSTGDWPGSCSWEKDGLTDNDKKNGAYLPYYSIQMTTVVNCAPPDMPPAPGGGGGGATTPTPPSDYDPCPGGAGAIAYANVYGGLKLAVAAGNPCDGGETGLTPIPTNPAAAAIQSLIANLPITDYPQQQYLYNNTIVAVAIYNYLSTNGWTPDNKGFASWAIGYLMGNPNVSINQFENWFMGKPEGIDGDYDATFWDNPNLIFQQQNLPRLNDFKNAYPKNSNGNFEMTYAEVYNLVGGEPKAMRDAVLNDNNPINDHDFDNACALRTSRALNYSGVIIPNIPGKTFKGADNKFYFLGARNLYNWMIKTFPPNDANSVVLNQQQGGINGMNFQSLLSNKQRIYILIPNNPAISGFGASGHAGIYTTPDLTHYYFGAKGGVKSITLWILK